MIVVTCDRCGTSNAVQGVVVCQIDIDLCSPCQRDIERFAKGKINR